MAFLFHKFQEAKSSQSIRQIKKKLCCCWSVYLMPGELRRWFGRMVACFRYVSINVHSVYLPPPKLDFNYRHQEWVEKEANEVANSTELLFNVVLNVLAKLRETRPCTGSLDGNVKILESRKNFVELEGMLQVEKAEFELAHYRAGAVSWLEVAGMAGFEVIIVSRVIELRCREFRRRDGREAHAGREDAGYGSAASVDQALGLCSQERANSMCDF